MTASSLLGSQAEQFAAELLRDRGYSVTAFKTNNPTYDLEIKGSTPFNVSVKASKAKQHVRLGSLDSVARLSARNFVFAFMPAIEEREINFATEGFRLLIIPAEVAREDSMAVRKTYLEWKGYDSESYNYSLLVKGYSRREHQVEIWRKWTKFENAWALLPNP